MLLPFSAIPSSFDLCLFYGSLHSKTSKPAAHVQTQSKPVKERESESDSSESDNLKRKHRSNINGTKSVSSNKEKSHVLVHGDTFKTSCGLNRSDSSVVLKGQVAQVVLIRVQVVVLLVQM